MALKATRARAGRRSDRVSVCIIALSLNEHARRTARKGWASSNAACCNGQGRLQDLLDLVVHDEDDGATGSTDDVGQGSLEESTHALLGGDLAPAVHGARVLALGDGQARLHHHPAADGVEGVRDDAGDGGDHLGDHPGRPDGGVTGVLKQGTLGGVKATEEGGAVHDDASQRDAEAAVQAGCAIGGNSLLQAVHQAVVLAGGAGANIGSQAGTGVIQGVHKQQRGTSGSTARCQVTGEEAPELGLLVHTGKEHLLVGILAGDTG